MSDDLAPWCPSGAPSGWVFTPRSHRRLPRAPRAATLLGSVGNHVENM